MACGIVRNDALSVSARWVCTPTYLQHKPNHSNLYDTHQILSTYGTICNRVKRIMTHSTPVALRFCEAQSMQIHIQTTLPLADAQMQKLTGDYNT